jgi:hypothetical protein
VAFAASALETVIENSVAERDEFELYGDLVGGR